MDIILLITPIIRTNNGNVYPRNRQQTVGRSVGRQTRQKPRQLFLSDIGQPVTAHQPCIFSRVVTSCHPNDMIVRERKPPGLRLTMANLDWFGQRCAHDVHDVQE